MKNEDLKKMRSEITELIDDVKYESDRLTDFDRLPVIQLKAILGKMTKMKEKTVILLHYLELMEKNLSTSSEEKAIEAKLPEEFEKKEEVVPVEEKAETSHIEEEISFVVRKDEVVNESESQKEADPELSFDSEKEEEIQESDEVLREDAEVNQKNIEEKLKNLVVTDLNKAIGINEKYQYASEMFSGDTEKLASVLGDLDSLSSFREAETYMRDLVMEYKWDLENITVKTFIDLVERKFNQS